MTISIDPTAYIIGPARVYYRAIGVLTPWTDIGATLDDAVLRVTREWFRPDNIAGAISPIQGLDVLRKEMAEVEFTMPEIAGSKLALALPGAVVTPEVHAAAGTPFSTTLSADAAAGATTIAVTSATTNLAVGDYILIAGALGTEYRQVTAIDTLNVSFRDPLLWAHASGQATSEVTGDYRTQITGAVNPGRMPDSEYREWALVASNGHGYQELRIPRGISTTDSAEVTVGDNQLSGIRVKIAARRLGSSMGTSSFILYGPAN